MAIEDLKRYVNGRLKYIACKSMTTNAYLGAALVAYSGLDAAFGHPLCHHESGWPGSHYKDVDLFRLDAVRCPIRSHHFSESWQASIRHAKRRVETCLIKDAQR